MHPHKPQKGMDMKKLARTWTRGLHLLLPILARRKGGIIQWLITIWQLLCFGSFGHGCFSWS